MRSRLLFALCYAGLLVVSAAMLAFQTQRPPDPISIFVGSGKEVTITFPNMSKSDLSDLLAALFTQEKPERKEQLRGKLVGASELTLVMTTKRGRP